MHCMKCGRKIADDQAFCPKCLELMAQEPVPHDVVVQLPSRKDPVQKKYIPRKKIRSTEEQLLRVKKRNRWLIVAVCLLTLISMALAATSVYFLRKYEAQRSLGQNYSTVESAE